MSQRPDPLRQAAEEPFNDRMIRHCGFRARLFDNSVSGRPSAPRMERDRFSAPRAHAMLTGYAQARGRAFPTQRRPRQPRMSRELGSSRSPERRSDSLTA